MKSPALQAFAKFILLSAQGQSELSGDVPTEEELAALLDNRLAFKRKQQVYAYLNRSPELFAKWMLLVEAVNDIKFVPEKNIGFWSRLSVALSSSTIKKWSLSAAFLLIVAISLTTILFKDKSDYENTDGVMSVSDSVLNKLNAEAHLQVVLNSYLSLCHQTGAVEKINIDNFYLQFSRVKNKYVVEQKEILAPLNMLDKTSFTTNKEACGFVTKLQHNIDMAE